VQQTPVRPCTPDCPVVHRTLSGAPCWSSVNWPLSGFNGGVRLKITGLSGGAPDCSVSQQSPAPTVGRAIFARHVVAPTVGWAHQTVSGAPTDPEDQQSAALRLERNRAPDMNSSCPVVHRTVWCTTRQKARLAFQVGLQRLLAALGV
jgi:hypothetical protein